MSSRSFCLCALLLLHFHPLLGPHALAAAASTPGSINLYNDYDCDHPSALNPTVSLSLSTCLVTTGGEGLVINTYPPCTQGSASMIYYQDAACGVQAKISSSIFSETCFQLADGTDIFNARAVMFSCQPAANNPRPSSTSTAVVSALAAVATGSAGSDGSTSGSGSGSGSSSSITSTTSATPTGTTSAGKNSTGGGSSSGDSNSSGGTTTSSDTNSGSGSHLDTSDIIALAVGLGIGLLTITIMIAAWLFPDFRHKLRRWITCGTKPHWAFSNQDNGAHQRHHRNETRQMY